MASTSGEDGRIDENTSLVRDTLEMEQPTTIQSTWRSAVLSGMCGLCRVLICGCSVVLILVVLPACSSCALFIYVYCYFGQEDHFLQFVSHFCYWPIVMSVQIILIIALWVRYSAEDVTEISWANVFRFSKQEQTTRNEAARSLCSRFNRVCIWMIYFGFPVGHSTLKIIYSKKLHPECLNRRQCFWIGTEIAGAFFFSFFCYFLLKRREELQKFRRESKAYVRNHIRELNLCIEQARKLFQEYYQLQKFLVPWMYLTVLSSMFGIGVFITWNYNKDSTMTSLLSYKGKEIGRCTTSCDTKDFMREDRVLMLYNLWVFWRHIMILLLPCFSAGGLDVSHVWDDFKMDLNSMYSSDNVEFWEHLRKFVDHLDPQKSSHNTLSLLLGAGALAAGILSGQNSNF